jgi:hypothetical protein
VDCQPGDKQIFRVQQQGLVVKKISVKVPLSHSSTGSSKINTSSQTFWRAPKSKAHQYQIHQVPVVLPRGLFVVLKMFTRWQEYRLSESSLVRRVVCNYPTQCFMFQVSKAVNRWILHGVLNVQPYCSYNIEPSIRLQGYPRRCT